MKILKLNLSKILEESSLPSFLLDKDNRILLANEPFLRLLGKSREEVEGKFCYEVVHGLKELPSFCPLKEGEVCLLTGCEGDKICPVCKICEEKPKEEGLKGIYFKEFFEPRLQKDLRVTLLPLYDERGDFFGYLHFIEDRTEEKEHEELLKRVVETYPGLFFVNDEEFNILYMNKNLKTLCQRERDKCFEVIYGKDKPCEGCPLLTEKVEGYDEVYSPKLSRYFLRYFKTFRSKTGKTLKITFYSDVTEQVRLFEEAAIPLVVATPEGEILKVNSRVRELFGLPEGVDLRNYRASDFWQDPEERKKFLERLFQEKRVTDLEMPFKKLDGTPFYALISSRLFEENGKLLIYTALEDITSYVRAKTEALQFLERVLEFMPVGVAVVNEFDEVLFANPRLLEITGYSQEELLGKRLHHLLSPEESLRQRAREVFEKIARGERSRLARRRVEFPARKKNGETFLAEVYFDEFYLEGRRLFIGLLQDITERKKLEEEVYRKEKEAAIEKIAGGLAHDLNNLLMIVKGYLELLRDRVKGHHEEAKTYMEKTLLAFERMRQLVSELFVLSRGEMKKEEVMEVSGFLKAWVPFYLRGSQIKLEMELEENLQVPLQESHLLSLIQNIVLNAREAMENVGELKIRAYKEKGRAVLEFQDSGPGIPQKLLDKIFEPGFSTKVHGTGLGLYVVKRIIELYQGKIEIESKPSLGTKVILRLPLIELKKKEVPLEERRPQELVPQRVLVLDDEAEIREVVRDFLSGYGFEVITVANGDEAKALIKRAREEGRPPSVLLLDLTVPEGKGGVYLLKELLKEGFSLSEFKVILMTGFTEKEVMEEAKGLKLDAVLYKPFSLERLLKVLST